MAAWVWLNLPLAAAFFATWVGVPLWLVTRRPETRAPAAAGARAARAGAWRGTEAPARRPAPAGYPLASLGHASISRGGERRPRVPACPALALPLTAGPPGCAERARTGNAKRRRVTGCR